MFLPHFKIASRRLIVFLLFALMFTSGVLVFASWKISARKANEVAAPSQQQPRSNNELEAEIVTATPTGFEPSDISRPQGRFLLAVDNRSGLGDLDLYLERQTGGRVNVVLGRKGKLAWRQELDLPPGQYILRAANDESWQCNLTLSPR